MATLYVNSAWDENSTLDTNLKFGVNAFNNSADALDKANELGGATINVDDMGDASQSSEFALTGAGEYVVTGGNGSKFTPILVNGKDVKLKFDGAFVTLGKLRGGKDGAGVYQKNSIEIVDSVIAQTTYAGYGGGWATFYDCSVTISNSIYGINLSKYDNALELPRSAEDIKAAIEKGEYTLASGFGYDGQHIGTVGFLDIDDSTVFTGFFSVSDRGYADIDNSVIYLCGGMGIGDGTIKNGDNSNESGWGSTSAEDYRVGEVATMDVTDSIVRNLSLNGNGGGLQVGGDNKAGVLNITNSEVDFTVKADNCDKVAIYENGTINMTDSVFKAGSVTNNGSINISGASDINSVVSGKGWIYMDNATLDADTNIQGANVRFTNGTSTLDGATIKGNAFQVGVGGYQFKDERENVADVVVNVTNGSFIGGPDIDYNGWVGTGWFEDDASKAAAMTAARYTLNIDKSNANFGYLHVSNDGILNVTGNAEEMQKYTGVDHSFYTGRFIVNGVATFDGVNTLVQFTNVSPDNGSEIPGKLVIKNGANYVSYLDSTSLQETVKISKNGIIEVDNATLDARHTTLIGEDGTLSVNNGNFLGNSVTNNGTFNVTGESTLNIGTLTGAMNIKNAVLLNGTAIGGDGGYESTNYVDFTGDAVEIQGTVSISPRIDTYTDVTVTAGAVLNSDWICMRDAAKTFTVEDTATLNCGTFWSSVSNPAYANISGTLDAEDKVYLHNGDVYGKLVVGKQLITYSNDALNIHGEVEIECTTAQTGWLIGNVSSSTGAYAGDITVNVMGGSVYVAGNDWGNEINIADNGILEITSKKVEGNTIKGSVTVGKGIVNNKGELKIDGGTLGVNYKIENTGSMNWKDANVTVTYGNGWGAINNNGTITVDANSLITAGSITGEGLITIDGTNFAGGVKTIIDLNGTESLEGKVTIKGEGITAIYGEDGDVMITDASTDILYVNSAWADKKAGEVLGEGLVFGVNAFDSLLNYSASADTTTLNIADGTYSSVFNTTTDVSVLKSGISNVVTDGDVIVNVGSLVFETEVEGEVTISGNFTTTDTNTWNYEYNMMPYYNGAIQFKGTEDTIFKLDGTFNAAEGFTFDAGQTVISEDSVLTVNDQNCGQINVYGKVVNKGQMTVDLQKGSTLRLVNIGNDGSLILSGEDASLTTNIVNDVPWAGAQCVDFYISNGSLVVKDGAEVSATGIVDVYADGDILIDNASFTAGSVKQNGIVAVTGESTVKAVVSGNGWINMDSVTLDDKTDIQGGKVRFVNGESTLAGATVNADAFQVGFGAYQATDERETVADIIVNVTDNSYIHADDVDYYGWVGTGWFESDEDKAAAMTDARYTLNISNSVAEFGYFHVSTDGILNVTGNADTKETYTGVDYSYYTGKTMINGIATFDSVDVLALFTNVSCDNGTENGGKLIIKNGANYVSWVDSTSTQSTFKISKTGVVEVDNATLDARHNTLIAEDASLIVKNGGTVTANSGAFSSITNNGTISVTDSTLNAYTLTNNGTFTIGTVYDETVTKDVASTNIIKIGEFTGKITLTDEAIIAETSSIKTTKDGEIYVADDATLYWDTVSGANITVFEDLAFEGVDFSSDTVTIYDGKFSWDAKGNSADQELIINGATVVWDKGAATVVDAETRKVYNVVISETGITATHNADAVYTPMTLTADVVQTKGSHEFTINATAVNGKGDYTYVYELNGEVITGPTFTLDPAVTSANVVVTVFDSFGESTKVTSNIQVDVTDYTAPTLELSADQSAWVNDNITIKLSSTDNFAAGVTYEYFNGSAWEKLNGATYDATINGTYKFRAVDDAGNVSAEKTIEIEKIDKTPATLTIVGNVEGWTNGDVTLEAVVQDEGAVTTQFRTDGGTTWTDGSTVTVTENTDVTFKVTDRAGNVTEKTVTVNNIDKTPIAITVYTDYVDGWSNQNVVLTVSANETPSTTVLKATVDGKEAELTNGGTLKFDQDGTYDVIFSASNSAGTEAETSKKTIKIDKTAPVVNAEFELKGSDIVVRWTAEDENGSDIASLTLNGEDGIGLEGSKTFTAVAGLNKFEFIATDLAGNETTESIEVKVSAGISGGAGDSEGETSNKNITVNNKTTEGVLDELENNYTVLDEGKSNISVQGGKSDEVKEVTIQGVGKDGDGVNNVKVGSNTALIVKDNISNLGNVNVGNNAKLHIMTENKGGILEGTKANQTIKTGKNSEIAVHGDWKFNGGNNTIKTGNDSTLTADDVKMSEGNDKITVGKDAAVNAGVLNLDKGKNQINVGNDADWVSKDVKSGSGNDTFKLNNDADATILGVVDMGEGKNKINLGNDSDWASDGITFYAGNDTFQIGSHADAHVYGNLELGGGNDTIKIGKDSELEVVSTEEKPGGDVNFGSGKDSFQIGADTDVDIDGDVVMGDGNDTFKVGSDSQVIIDGALNLGEGKDTVTLQKKAVLEVGSIVGFEVFNASKGAELWTNAQVEFDNVKGSWKNLEIIHNITNAADLEKGSVYGNESDIYTFGKDTEISGIAGLLEDGLRVEYSTDGIIWSSIDQDVATFAADSSIKISSTNDYNVKKEYSLAIG